MTGPPPRRLATWTLELGAGEAESPIGRYAATLALLVLGRDHEAIVHADAIRTRDDFPNDVGDALAFIAVQDIVGYASAVESVLESFETRDEYLEDIPVADTVLVLQALAARRGIASELSSRSSPGSLGGWRKAVITIGSSDESSMSRAFSTSSVISSSLVGVTRAVTCAVRN